MSSRKLSSCEKRLQKAARFLGAIEEVENNQFKFKFHHFLSATAAIFKLKLTRHFLKDEFLSTYYRQDIDIPAKEAARGLIALNRNGYQPRINQILLENQPYQTNIAICKNILIEDSQSEVNTDLLQYAAATYCESTATSQKFAELKPLTTALKLAASLKEDCKIDPETTLREGIEALKRYSQKGSAPKIFTEICNDETILNDLRILASKNNPELKQVALAIAERMLDYGLQNFMEEDIQATKEGKGQHPKCEAAPLKIFNLVVTHSTNTALTTKSDNATVDVALAYYRTPLLDRYEKKQALTRIKDHAHIPVDPTDPRNNSVSLKSASKTAEILLHILALQDERMSQREFISTCKMLGKSVKPDKKANPETMQILNEMIGEILQSKDKTHFLEAIKQA